MTIEAQNAINELYGRSLVADAEPDEGDIDICVSIPPTTWAMLQAFLERPEIRNSGIGAPEVIKMALVLYLVMAGAEPD